MTLEECFREMHGDYASAKIRLMNDTLVDRFVRKFPADPSMNQLREAVSQNDRKGAFVAVHTLKGVAANLSFTELQQAASNLTEQLRDGEQDPDMALYDAVNRAYDRVIEALKRYMN